MDAREFRNRFVRVLLVFILIFATSMIFAQEGDEFLEEEDTTEAICKPENLQTAYDKFASDSITVSQVSIWYDYGREYYKKARYGQKENNYKEAIPFFWKVILNDQSGRFKVSYSRLTDCYIQINEIDSALIVAFRGLEKYPDYASLHYHAGQIFKTRGQARCAIPHYEALVASNPDDTGVLKNYWSVLAQLYLKLEDERAIEAQRHVVELDPHDVEAATLRAQIINYFGMDPLKAMQEAFERDTSNVQNARTFGKTAFEAGEYRKALRAYKAVLKTEPKNLEAMDYIGRSYEALEKPTQAIAIYKEALEVDPERLNTICAIASVYARLNNFTTARSYVRRALRINSNYGLAYMVMGEVYENAVTYCSNQREEDKGYTYDDKLVFEKAQEQYQNAARRDPNFAATATNRMKLLEPFVRTKADIHMHSNRENIKDSCYDWISNGLP